jgi:O-acetyl-ADP-ribose deacetylase
MSSPSTRDPLRLALPNGATITFTVGDITQETTDAIVNAANSSLMGGGGVDGAIHRAGGPAILEQCKQIVARQGQLPPGEAVATTGGRLAAKYVIHTVGPIWSGGQKGESGVLERCYRNSIRVADELRLRSVSFPSISTGAYGYPIREAASVAVKAVIHALKQLATPSVVTFVLFDERTHEQYVNAARLALRDGLAKSLETYVRAK